MPSSDERFSQLRWLHNIVSGGAIIGAIILIGLGLFGENAPGRGWWAFAGFFVLFLTVLSMVATALLLKIEATLAGELRELRSLNEMVIAQGKTLGAIAENSQLSDAAKSLTYRHQETETLRAAIRAEMKAHRWEQAGGLIDEMERRFGFKQEAEAIREELDDVRRDAIQLKLKEAISLIESHFKVHDWDRAQNEIDRLLHALPNDAKVLSLQDRMRILRDERKQELKLAWDEAVRRSDTDRAIDILKELDEYLSPAEAESLQVSARDVFKEKLLQLGVQFRFAVTEKRWHDALTIGYELVRDFPNSRMAAEVRDALGALRERASQIGQQAAPEAAASA